MCTSMFDFCVRRLGMSEGAAFRRINAARLVKRFPVDDAQASALAAAVGGKTQREVKELLVREFFRQRWQIPTSVPVAEAQRLCVTFQVNVSPELVTWHVRG